MDDAKQITVDQIKRYCEIKKDGFGFLATSEVLTKKQRTEYAARALQCFDLLTIIKTLNHTELEEILEA